jgi:hypothetical protein
VKGDMMTEKDLTTYCGIYCGDCPRYKAKFSDMCSDLLDEFENSHFSKLAKVIATKNDKFEKYDEMLSLLKTINDLKCEAPCRLGGGRGESCEVIVCNKSKNIDGCWDCIEFETCPKLDFLKPFCKNAPIKNLRKIKKLGVENWAENREKQYPWM